MIKATVKVECESCGEVEVLFPWLADNRPFKEIINTYLERTGWTDTLCQDCKNMYVAMPYENTLTEEYY